MNSKDPRLDTYIAAAQPFARPLLAHLRKIVHTACADAEETIKWGFPNFIYRKKILCSMAAFKQHCSFGFWLESALKTLEPYRQREQAKGAMGSFGKLTSLQDLPPDKVLIKCIQEAMFLTEKGVVLQKTAVKKPALPVPGYFEELLVKNKKAKAAFEQLPPSHRNEYIEWITTAKTAPTRQKRMAAALQWIAEGKVRNWKYESK